MITVVVLGTGIIVAARNTIINDEITIDSFAFDCTTVSMTF